MAHMPRSLKGTLALGKSKLRYGTNMTSDKDREVYQATLDRFIDALWQRDEAAVTAFLDVPFRFGLKNYEKRYTDIRALTHLFFGWRNALEVMETEVFHCTCRTVSPIQDADQDGLIGHHETYLICGNRFLREPFLCSMRLKDDGGHLRLSEWTILLNGRELSAPCQVCFEEAGFDLDATNASFNRTAL